MKRVGFAITALAIAGCASPLGEQGEQLYRAGDLRGALESWRASDDDDLAPRIAAVERELTARVDGYVASARVLEREGRLAESILDYRLALALRPDTETLAHVQMLARELMVQRAELRDAYRQVRQKGDLAAASQALERLRRLDPFEPEYETEGRRLRAAIAEEWRQQQAAMAEELRQQQALLREQQALLREQQAPRVDSLVDAGRAAFQDEQLETALDLWRRALRMDPHNERLQDYIARAERELETLERMRTEPEAGS
jgi:tetratricopeptide (TPR) repeat protein